MKTYKCLIFVNTLLITFACGKSSLQRYAPSTTYPRAIYVENQIDKIWTEGKIETDKFLYIDISLDNGRKESGKLIQISEEYVELSHGYYYKRDKEDNIIKSEKIITVPKSEILIMKIW